MSEAADETTGEEDGAQAVAEYSATSASLDSDVIDRALAGLVWFGADDVDDPFSDNDSTDTLVERL